MLIVNHLIRNVIKLCISSATTSFQLELKRAFRLVPLVILIFLGPTAFSSTTINGVIDGDTSKARAEDARYERIYALWGALVTIANGEIQLPRLSAQEVLTFIAGVHTGEYYKFGERQIFDILPSPGQTFFNPIRIGDKVTSFIFLKYCRTKNSKKACQ